MKNIVLIAISLVVLVSCKKEGCMDATATNYSLEATKDDGSCIYAQPTGNVSVSFNLYFQDENLPFELNEQYVNNGDTLNFSTLKYYVSNFKLKKDDGTWWVHPESYFLVDVSDANGNSCVINGVPVGNYVEMAYILGVDSVRNVSGAQTGALSTSNGMFWSWNTGYIMVKAEGTSPQSTNGNAFSYHLGGFSGVNNIVTTKSHVFNGALLSIEKGATKTIYLKADVAKLFEAIGSVSVVSTVHMPGQNATAMGRDFFNGFEFDYLGN
ncbi:MAG TPA: MbnP family protein [Taishania sp.]|nr:MbnP family protein [Taishania sp.]